MVRILIAEDEKPISDLIALSLKQADHICDQAFDGEAAVEKIEHSAYDLVLLDIMLPKIDGYQLMDYLRDKELPVIFVSAKGTVADKVKGLKLGADDYLAKPFDTTELLARVESVLRRYQKEVTHFEVADLTIDTQSRTVRKDGVPVALTYKEFDLLLLFVQNRNVALFRERIYERIWGDSFMGNTRTVDLHVQRLRKKLGLEERLVAVYKVGYRFEDAS